MFLFLSLSTTIPNKIERPNWHAIIRHNKQETQFDLVSRQKTLFMLLCVLIFIEVYYKKKLTA